jgi:hypothetical protein
MVMANILLEVERHEEQEGSKFVKCLPNDNMCSSPVQKEDLGLGNHIVLQQGKSSQWNLLNNTKRKFIPDIDHVLG